jgi:hypothetical protein
MQFPVLVFGKNGQMLAFKCHKDLTTPAYSFWKAGKHKGLSIVDSAGLEFIVKSAKKIGYPGLFVGYSLFRHRGVRVQLCFQSEPRFLPIEQFKAKVISSFKSDWRSWSSTDMKGVLKQIESASTYRDIIEVAL